MIQPQDLEHIPGLEDDQVDRDDEQQLREHLDQQQGKHAHAASAEPESAERVRRERAQQHAEDGDSRRHDDRVDQPVNVMRARLGARPGHICLEERAEVVEGDVARDQPCAGQGRVGAERGGDDVRSGEEREEQRQDPHRVPPPRVLELRPPAAWLPRDALCRCGFDLFDRRHARFSRARVRENEIAEMVATIKKMMIVIALARPKSWPLPVTSATLYV